MRRPAAFSSVSQRVIAEAADGRLPSFRSGRWGRRWGPGKQRTAVIGLARAYGPSVDSNARVWPPGGWVACARMSVIRPCLVHRCPEYAVTGESYCKQHLYRRNDLGMTGARGTTAYWRRVRKVAKQKARFRCEECGKRETVDDMLTVHHRDHNARNNDPENLQALCAHCHKAKHKSRLKV